MSRKEQYMDLLKESLSEFDTTKTTDVKGPMLDPILGYQGQGEIETHKDAASVLERFYFKQDERLQTLDEIEDISTADEDNTDDYDKDGKVKSEVSTLKSEIEKELKEAVEDLSTADEDNTEEYDKDGKVVGDGTKVIEDELKEAESFVENIENDVIEKLIAEMEDLDMDSESLFEGEDAELDVDKEIDGSDSDDADGKEEPESKEEEEAEEVPEKQVSELAVHMQGPLCDEEELEEAFELFREQIEEEVDVVDVDDIGDILV